MTSLTSIELDSSLQALVDARLDSIDRMLMGHVPRSDRQAILKDVESQIEELISQIEQENPGREEILHVLAQLDPPEAYLPGELDPSTSRFPLKDHFKVALKGPGMKPETKAIPNRQGLISGLVGMACLGLSFIASPSVTLLAIVTHSDTLFILGLSAAGVIGFIAGVFGLILGIVSLGKGKWPVVGIFTSSFSILISILFPLAWYFLIE